MVAFYFAAGGGSINGRAADSHKIANRRIRRSIPLGEDLHLPGIAKPHALGANTLTIAEIEMDHATVGRRHGLQGDAPSGLRDAVGDTVGHFAQGILPSLPVLLNIQRHADIFIVSLPHDALNDELQGMQGIAAPADQEPGVRSVDVDHRATRQLVVLGAKSDVDVGADGGEDMLDCLYGGPGRGVGSYGQNRRGLIVPGWFVRQVRFIRLVFVGIGLELLRGSGWRGADARNANLGQFTTDAQETLAAPI